MSYASGFMMGTAIVQGIGQLLGGMGSPKGMGGLGQGMRPGKGRGRGFSLDSLDSLSLPQLQPGGTMPKAGSFDLVSSLPGRRRYRMVGMTENQARMFEDVLKRLPYMKDVTANPISGSLLLVYDASMEEQLDEIAAALKRCVLKTFVPMQGTTAGQACVPVGFPLAESPIGDLTRVIHKSAQDFNLWVQRNTQGFFDASSLISLLFFIQGIRKLLLTQQFPSGVQMLWWAVSLMRGWR